MRANLIAFALAAVVAGCSGGAGGARMNTDIRRGPMPTGGAWAGIWFTTWGEMSLSTQGSSVVGEFCDEDSNRYGRLEGTAQGNVFSFHWITTDVTMAGSPRTTEGSGIIQFSFVDAGEAQQGHFEGSWGYEASNADGGPLSGERSSRYSDQFLRGSYSVECPIREAEEAGPPLSEDDVGDNPGEGEVGEDDLGDGLDEGTSDDAGGEDPTDDFDI